MYHLKPLKDPLGNHFLLPFRFDLQDRSYDDIRQVIGDPTFLIREKNNRKLYFFRLIHFNVNLLVEAHLSSKGFVIKGCMENPTADYISVLLSKGALSSF